MDITEAVANGIELLNGSGPPEWWNRIDCDYLDLSDGEFCILGQVFAADAAETGYGSGYDFFTQNSSVCPQFISDHGFIATGATGYAQLGAAWIVAIENLKAEVYA